MAQLQAAIPRHCLQISSLDSKEQASSHQGFFFPKFSIYGDFVMGIRLCKSSACLIIPKLWDCHPLACPLDLAVGSEPGALLPGRGVESWLCWVGGRFSSLPPCCTSTIACLGCFLPPAPSPLVLKGSYLAHWCHKANRYNSANFDTFWDFRWMSLPSTFPW